MLFRSDEVLAVGDMAFQKKCLAKMREAANKEGRTVLYVSHNMNTIRQLCDRCIVLDKGKIIFDGDVEKAIDTYMQTNEEDAMKKDFSDYKRSIWLNQKVKLLFAEFVGKKDNSYYAFEEMRIKLCWEVLKEVKNLGIRLEVWSLDNNPQASYIIHNLCDASETGLFETVLKLDRKSVV